MKVKNEYLKLTGFIAVFLGIFYLPVDNPVFRNAIFESLALVRWYAREHVVLCLIPAFFIAGAISVFVSQASVMKYLGPKANKILAYGVASISGSILAVCSCTVLPLFSGIYKMGAGLGPASAFLYSGPAINVLAIILTARVLGPELGIARAFGAVVFSIIIGIMMHLIFRKEESEKINARIVMPDSEPKRALWKDIIYFVSLIGILVFANWGRPETSSGIWFLIFSLKWIMTAAFGLLLGVTLIAWFELSWIKVGAVAIITGVTAALFPGNHMAPFIAAVVGLSFITGTDAGETKDWLDASWGFAKQILPLLLFGVLIAGGILGRPGHEGLIPSAWVSRAVGGNSLLSNFTASVLGAFMYFATLTEVPIVQGLIGSGMGKGPALALLLAGPALSLPSMLVIRGVLGTKKTAVFVSLVVVMATISGMVYGYLG